jgi:DNA-binding response OmpR family regulator
MRNSAPNRHLQPAAPVRIAARPTICVVDPRGEDYRPWHEEAREHGLNLQVLASSEEALRLAGTMRIELWVINTRLPGLSGCELCDMIRAHFLGAEVYLVADEYSADEERRAWAARASMFGCKPAHSAWLQCWRERRGPRCRAPVAGRAA